MHAAWHRAFLLATVLLTAACGRMSRSDREIGRLLTELDGYVGD